MLAGCHCIPNSERQAALWGSRIVLPSKLITHCKPLPREVKKVWDIEWVATFLGYLDFSLCGEGSWSRCRKFNTFYKRCSITCRRRWRCNPCLWGTFSLVRTNSDLSNSIAGARYVGKIRDLEPLRLRSNPFPIPTTCPVAWSKWFHLSESWFLYS